MQAKTSSRITRTPDSPAVCSQSRMSRSGHISSLVPGTGMNATLLPVEQDPARLAHTYYGIGLCPLQRSLNGANSMAATDSSSRSMIRDVYATTSRLSENHQQRLFLEDRTASLLLLGQKPTDRLCGDDQPRLEICRSCPRHIPLLLPGFSAGAVSNAAKATEALTRRTTIIS